MKLFKREFSFKRKDARLATISVPNLKEYIISEYERANNLAAHAAELEAKLEEAEKIQAQYDVALVTLEEYSKRIETLKAELKAEKDRVAAADKEAARAKESAYVCECELKKIKRNERSEIQAAVDDAIEKIKQVIIKDINNKKGNISKSSACIIVKSATIYEVDRCR